MKISNKQNNDTMKKFFRKNKKSIKDLFYSITDSDDHTKGSINNKLLILFLSLFGISQTMLLCNIHAGVIVAIASAVVGSTYLVVETKDLIKELIKHREAKRAYEETREIYEPYNNELEREVHPVLASYHMTNSKGNTRQINMIINGKNHKMDSFPGVINMILTDGTVIVAKDDSFMQTALKIDEMLFNIQYDNFEHDMNLLHSIIKSYVDLKSVNSSEYSEQESKLYHELGRMYAIVNQKVNNHKAKNSKLRLVLKKDERDSTKK